MKNTASARFVLFVGAIAALALAVPSAASAEPVAGVVNLSNFSPTTSESSCASSSIATNPVSGATVAAWAGLIAGPNLSAPLNAAVIGADGVAGPTATYQPADAFLVADLGGACNPVSIDAGASGGFLLSWNSSNDSSVFGILVSSAGAFIGGPFQISSNSNYADIETVTAAWSEAQSRYLVTWKANVASPFPAAIGLQQVVGRFVDGAGTPLGADFLVTDLFGQVDNSQDVAFGAGVWIAVGVNDGTGLVQTVTISSTGVVGPAVPVPSPSGSSTGPSIIFNAALNQFMVVAKSGSTLWGQLLDATGAISGAPFAIFTYPSSPPGRPRVASLEADGWIVTWHSPSSLDVVAIEIDAAAAVVGTPEFLSSGVNSAAVENDFRPEVAFSPTTGQSYVLWSRYVAATDSTDVVVRAWGAAAVVPAGPALAATGLDGDRVTTLVGAVGALMTIGGLALAVSRRRARIVGAHSTTVPSR